MIPMEPIVFVDARSQVHSPIMMPPKLEQGISDLEASELGREDDHDCRGHSLPATPCSICCPLVQEFRQDHGFAGSWRTADGADRLCFNGVSNCVRVALDRQAVLVASPGQSRKLADMCRLRRNPFAPAAQHCLCIADVERCGSPTHSRLEPNQRRIRVLRLLHCCEVFVFYSDVCSLASSLAAADFSY